MADLSKKGFGGNVRRELKGGKSSGAFGKPSKKSRITNRKDKARVVAKKQQVGPEVEDRIALLFARNIEKNLKRLTNRPTIIRM